MARREYQRYHKPTYHKHHKTKQRSFNWFNVVKAPFALLSVVALVWALLYTFSLVFFVGFAIAIAGMLIRWIQPQAAGMSFLYDTLALGGVFIVVLAVLIFRIPLG